MGLFEDGRKVREDWYLKAVETYKSFSEILEERIERNWEMSFHTLFGMMAFGTYYDEEIRKIAERDNTPLEYIGTRLYMKIRDALKRNIKDFIKKRRLEERLEALRKDLGEKYYKIIEEDLKKIIGVLYVMFTGWGYVNLLNSIFKEIKETAKRKERMKLNDYVEIFSRYFQEAKEYKIADLQGKIDELLGKIGSVWRKEEDVYFKLNRIVNTLAIAKTLLVGIVEKINNEGLHLYGDIPAVKDFLEPAVDGTIFKIVGKVLEKESYMIPPSTFGTILETLTGLEYIPMKRFIKALGEKEYPLASFRNLFGLRIAYIISENLSGKK